jgi:hypothetical protein
MPPDESGISPWATSADVASPDGRYRAWIEASEIGMGAPTSGRLHVVSVGDSRSSFSFDSCNPSLAWSDDSRQLAVPVWEPDRNQRLLIISLPKGTARLSTETYVVLRIHRFEGGVVSATDSPIYHPRLLEIEV